MRALYERHDGEKFVNEELDEELLVSIRKANAEPIDPRLCAVKRYLQAHCDDLTPAAELARRVGLSGSRIQDLFTSLIGMPFRRYRAWNRLRVAWRSVAAGETITSAVLAAGFFDSAHFSHEFRRTFGTTAAPNLKKAVRVNLIPGLIPSTMLTPSR